MARPVAVQRRKIALLLRQRPEAVLPLFLLGQARRHLHLRDGDGRGLVPRGRRAFGLRGRGRPAGAERGLPRERDPAARRPRGDGARLRLLRGAARRAGGGPRPRLSRRPRARRRDPPHLPPRLRAARALRVARPPRRPGRAGRADGGAEPSHHRRRHQGPVRPFSRPGDLPDPRRARPGRRLRRPRHEPGRQAEIPELLRDAALPQGADALQPPCRPQERPTPAG